MCQLLGDLQQLVHSAVDHHVQLANLQESEYGWHASHDDSRDPGDDFVPADQRNLPPIAASRMISRFLGSSMNLGSARISCVTIVPSCPTFRSLRPPPAGVSPRISRPYLVRDVGLAASLAA